MGYKMQKEDKLSIAKKSKVSETFYLQWEAILHQSNYNDIKMNTLALQIQGQKEQTHNSWKIGYIKH